MKLKSLILGSVAAAGLSTAGFAADLGVLTSLDVCDSLGISGLTISSADNCLQITGGVTYEFNWGDYNAAAWGVNTNDPGPINVMDNGASTAAPAQQGIWAIRNPDGSINATQFTGATAPTQAQIDAISAGGTAAQILAPTPAVAAGLDNDWSSDLDAWLQFVGTASSDFGPASATIKLALDGDAQYAATNELVTADGPDTPYSALVDQAYVSIGDTTTIMAGKKSSIANFGDDEPYNFLALFNSEAVDKGVMFVPDQPQEGGVSIQIVSQVADGLTLKAGLENLDDSVSADAGTAVGVIEYAGNGITAHLTGLVGGLLDGVVDDWAVHAGFTGTFDNFTVRGAAAYSYDVATTNSYWNVLGSAKATFDIFEIAISGEASDGTIFASQAGFGGSVGATVTEGVKINLGGRWYDENTAVANTETWQIAAQLVAAVSETVTITGEVGYYGTTEPVAVDSDLYGSAELAWAPGGGFTSSVKGQVHSTGAYKVTFKAAKEFK